MGVCVDELQWGLCAELMSVKPHPPSTSPQSTHRSTRTHTHARTHTQTDRQTEADTQAERDRESAEQTRIVVDLASIDKVRNANLNHRLIIEDIQLGQRKPSSRHDTIRNQRVLIQLAQCRFPRLAISNDKILTYFSNKIYGSNFIKHHWETVMVWNYQNADCSFSKKNYCVIEWGYLWLRPVDLSWVLAELEISVLNWSSAKTLVVLANWS